MVPDSFIHGVSIGLARPLLIKEMLPLLESPEAVLKLIGPAGKEIGSLPLITIPIYPVCGDNEYVFPELIQVTAIAAWEAPDWVSGLRLSIQGKGYMYLNLATKNSV